MQAKDVMTKAVNWIGPEASLREAAEKMKALDAGVLPVCNGKKLVGVLSDRDIVVRSTAGGQDPAATRVREVMSPKVEYCLDDEDVQRIAAKMEAKRIRRIFVIDHNRKLAGVISLGDLATRGEQKIACEVLEKVSQPNR